MAKSKSQPIRMSYDFFVEKQKSGELFTLEELCAVTGWGRATPATYVTKKWSGILRRVGDSFQVFGISQYDFESYKRLMSQKNTVSSDPQRPQLDPMVESLVNQAREAALNGLDSYNRTRTLFRTEGFIVMMNIAWRSLFHAIFTRDQKDYFYRDSNGVVEKIDDEDKAWDLAKCAREFYSGQSSAIHTNLQFMIGLRNKIEHRFAPGIDAKVAGECQAMLFNFDELLVAQFGEYYALRETLAIPLQTAKIRSNEQLKIMKTVQSEHYQQISQYIDAFREGIGEMYSNPQYSFRAYLVPKVGNHKSSSDFRRGSCILFFTTIKELSI